VIFRSQPGTLPPAGDETRAAESGRPAPEPWVPARRGGGMATRLYALPTHVRAAEQLLECALQPSVSPSAPMKLRPVIPYAAAALILAVFVWQAVYADGNPDPLDKNLSRTAAVMSTSVLVFREGLEAILVLAAVTAGMSRQRKKCVRAIPVGACFALLATAATWCAAVTVISEINAPELAVQAVTGLLAIVVLLVVMNWFFHKIYWTGWITHHNDRRRRLLHDAEETGRSPYFGLALLGFTAIYREGFEVVLFLQNLRLRAGSEVVFEGASVGAILTCIVAVLMFVAQKRLPYKRMLITTGILLGLVLLVMVGESVQEMQQAGWLSTTPTRFSLAPWLGLWFSLFPNVESLTAQFLAAILVIGSYYLAEHRQLGRLNVHQEQLRPSAAAPDLVVPYSKSRQQSDRDFSIGREAA